MQRVTRPSAVASPPDPPASPGTPGYFTGGNPATGTPATVPGYEWFNSVQEELLAPVLRAGLTPSAASATQLRQALDRLFGGALRSVTADTELSADDAGLVLVSAAGGPVTLTLPAAAAAGGRPLRITAIRTDDTAATVTIARAGADLIEGETSRALPRGGRLGLVSDGVSAWRVASSLNALRGMQVFTSSGTFTVPAGVYLVRAKVVGGGGGGGGAASDGAAAGGGGGGYAEGLVAVSPGQEISVTVGAAGAGGAAGNNTGGAGGTSSFGAHLSATGGAGGAGAPASSAAAASSAGAGAGPLALSGQQGDAGHRGGAGILKGGGGGSSACAFGLGGRGGPGPPSNASGRGGGGGGGANGNGGGTGTAGIVVVEW
jgi:hypothetical protein